MHSIPSKSFHPSPLFFSHSILSSPFINNTSTPQLTTVATTHHHCHPLPSPTFAATTVTRHRRHPQPSLPPPTSIPATAVAAIHHRRCHLRSSPPPTFDHRHHHRRCHLRSPPPSPPTSVIAINHHHPPPPPLPPATTVATATTSDHRRHPPSQLSTTTTHMGREPWAVITNNKTTNYWFIGAVTWAENTNKNQLKPIGSLGRCTQPIDAF
ncbi:velvet complex subunit B-like [Helianthus annuus]|uniref:velvet complex subunit B-like n=1 Tax=Helianthus annuus TaxID=4232 RepID=UPI000B8F6DFE|nr:velvet complex subunit B-like [Helianthus annuus]